MATLLTHLALSSSAFLAINMTVVAGCRRRKWMFSAISLLFLLPVVLPLLCVASFVAFVLSPPFCCALGGIWSWHRLRKLAAAIASPVTNGKTEESNNDEMDWSESDAESAVTDQDHAGIKSGDVALLERADEFEANNEIKAEGSADALVIADGVSKPWLLGVDFKETVGTQAVLKEAYGTLSCTEDSPFSEKRSEFMNLEQICGKYAVPDSPMGEAYKNRGDVVAQIWERAEEHERRITKGKKLSAESASGIPTPGNDYKKKRRRTRALRGGVKVVGTNCGGSLMRGRCSAEAGQTTMSGAKMSSAEAAIVSSMASDESSSRVMSSGVDSVYEKGTQQHRLDSSLAPELEDAWRRPPSTALDHGIMFASDKTSPQFYQLLEFWRRAEQAAPSIAYLSPHSPLL